MSRFSDLGTSLSLGEDVEWTAPCSLRKGGRGIIASYISQVCCLVWAQQIWLRFLCYWTEGICLHVGEDFWDPHIHFSLQWLHGAGGVSDQGKFKSQCHVEIAAAGCPTRLSSWLARRWYVFLHCCLEEAMQLLWGPVSSPTKWS